jgi:FlaG/FlaF family flagellin (archaellin)
MLYKILNGAAPTTASQVAVTTGTSIKTLLQVKPGATQVIKLVEWGISFDGSAAATPGIVELCVTDVAATVTAHVAAGIHKYDSGALAAGDPTTNIFAVGTTSTGYTSSGEGSITAVRQCDVQQIAPTNQTWFQFPLGREFVVNPSEFLRIRVKFGAAINAICYVLVEA